MASDYDQFDAEFDDSLDDLIDSDDNTKSLTDDTNQSKREVVTNTLTDVSKGFVDAYKDEPLENITKIVKASLPSEVSGEVSDLVNLKDTLKEEYTTVAKDVKKQARSTFAIVKRILPKNDLTNKISNKIDSILGKEDESNTSSKSKESLEDEIIKNNVNLGLGGDDNLTSIDNLFKNTLDQNRFKTLAQLSNITASTLREISLFNKQVTHNYYTKSLSLQYKSIFIAKEQLSVTKLMGDTFKNQFEAIIKNTALPDIIKIKSSEAIKHELRRKVTNDLASKMFSDGTMLGNAKNRISEVGNNLKDKVIGGLTSISDIAEQKEMMDGMSMPGISKGSMAGSFMADALNNVVGKNISRRVANSKIGKSAMYNLKNIMADPSAYLNKAADKIGYDGFLKTKANLGVRFASDVLKTNNKLTNITVGKDDLNDVKMFDGRAYASLTKVIPGLLSKIYGEIKSFRTKDNKPEANEITYDYDKSTFVKRSDVSTNLKHKLTTRIKNTSSVVLNTLTEDFIEKGGYKVKSKKDVELLNKIITQYVIKGKPLVPSLFKEYGFLELAPKNKRKALSSALDRMNVYFKNDIYANEYFIKNLKEYKNSLPKIEDELTSIIDSGNGGELVKNGIMDYDNVYGTYSTNEESLTNLYLGAVKGMHTDAKDKYSKKTKSDVTEKVKKATKKKATKNIKDEISEVNKPADVIEHTSKQQPAMNKIIPGTYRSTLTKSDVTEKVKKDINNSINEKIEKTTEEEGPDLKTLTSEQLAALKEDFLNSKAYAEGKVITFKEYLKSLNFPTEDTKQYLNNLVVKYKENATKAKEFILDRLNPNLKTITTEEEEVLKEEYTNSDAIKKGVTFKQYMKAFGFRPKLNIKQNIRALLKKTRALDRKIAMGAIKLPGKAIGGVSSTIGKLFKSKKDKDINSIPNTKIKDTLKTTRSLDKKIVKGVIGTTGKLASSTANIGKKIVSGTIKGTLGLAKDSTMLLGESLLKQLSGYDLWHKDKKKETKEDSVTIKKDTLKTLIRETTSAVMTKFTKKKKDNPFDKDGDGDRDGNWRDRLKGLFGSKTKDKRKNSILNFVKEHKGLSSTAILTGILIAMKTMGVSMDDVVNFAKGIWGGIKDIGSALSWVGGIIKKAFNGISGVIHGIGKFLGISSDGSKESSVDNITDVVDTGKNVAYGVAGYAAYKTGKGIYKTGKAITSVAKSVRGVVPKKTTANLTKKASSSVAKKLSKKGLAKKLLSYLSKFKTIIKRKVGPKIAAKLLGKVASRFVPILGWGLALYDAGMIAYDMYHNGTPFKNAVSKQILGFDIFNDETPVNENGEPIEDDTLEEKALAKVNMVNIDNSLNINKKITTTYTDEQQKKYKKLYGSDWKNVLEDRKSEDDAFGNGRVGATSKILKPLNNKTYKTNFSINKKIATIGDGEDKPTGGNIPANNDNFAGSREVKVRKGEEYPDDGGEDNIVTKSGVTIDGLNPAMLKKLKSMANEYNEITGKKILINSGYRSTADQIKLRKKYGNRAARPGHSTHEFGLAVDINGSTLDELDNLGLLGKYKLTRPVGGEKWHVEPAGIQLDINQAKKDPKYASNLVEAAPVGGSGWGLISGVRKYSRNKEYQKELLTEPKIKLINDTRKDIVDSVDTKATIPGLNKLNPSSTNSTIVSKKDKLPKVKDSVSALNRAASDNTTNNISSLVKPANASADIAKSSNVKLDGIHSTLKTSLDVQIQMLKALDNLNKKDIIKEKEKEETITASNNVKRLAPEIDRSSLPDPAVSLSRMRY